jgi:DNA-binding transcriptional LysR family regulator
MKNNMTTLQVEYILTLAEMKSFSKAAQKLYITQPSLSKYISSIEKQLGTILFDRSTSPISLTPAGLAYIEAARQISFIEDSFMNQLSDLEKLETGSLKIGSSTFRTSFLLSKSISKFCNEHSRISVSIADDNIEQLKIMLKNGEIDLIVGTGNYNIREYDYEELAEERIYLTIPENNPLNDVLAESRLSFDDIRTNNMKCLMAKPIDLKALEGKPFVLATQGEFGEDYIMDMFRSCHFHPNIALRVRTVEAAFSFSVSGFGLSMIPDTLIRFGNYLTHPYYYPIDADISTSNIRLVMRKNAYLSRAAKEYCLTLKKLVDAGTWRIA